MPNGLGISPGRAGAHRYRQPRPDRGTPAESARHRAARRGGAARLGGAAWGVGRGSVAPDGGISGSEKILERIPKIEI